VNGVIAAVVLFYVLRLSAGDRHLIDWIVIALVSSAILYNVVKFGMALQGAGTSEEE